MTVAEVQEAVQATTPPQTSEEEASPRVDSSAELTDDLWPSLEEEDIFEAATEQVNEEIEAEGADNDGEAEPAAAEDTPPDSWAEKFATLEKRFEDTQKWAQQLSTERGQLQKRLDELEQGVQTKATKSEQEAVFAELREAVKRDPDVFADPDKLNDHILTAADKIVEARTAKAFERLDKATKEYEQGMIYMAGFQQAGPQAPVLQQAVGYMANEYANRNNGARIFDDFSPQEVLAGAWQLVQQNQQSQTTNTQTQPTEASNGGGQGSETQQAQQSPSPQTPQPRPATSQPANTFTPERPSVGLSSGAVTTVTQGSPQDTRSAVLAALREVEQGG